MANRAASVRVDTPSFVKMRSRCDDTVLREIETKVSHLLTAIGHDEAHDHKDLGDTRTGDAALMNGPQMPANAISQADIDKLLASFD